MYAAQSRPVAGRSLTLRLRKRAISGWKLIKMRPCCPIESRQASVPQTESEGNDFKSLITIGCHARMAGHIIEKGQVLRLCRLKGPQFP